MGNTLRTRRAAVDWASEFQVVEVAEKISFFDRLVEIIDADLAALDSTAEPKDWRDNAVVGTLRFGFADARRSVATLEGQVQATVSAICQRCLEAFSFSLRVAPRLLLLARDESVDAVAEGFAEYEVWELDEGQLQPAELLEELLIMALPFAARHDKLDECTALVAAGESAADDRREDMRKPFAALRSQMQQHEKDPTN